MKFVSLTLSMRSSWACRRRETPAWTWGPPRPSWSPWRWRRPDLSSSGSSTPRCPRSDRTEKKSRTEISSALKEKSISWLAIFETPEVWGTGVFSKLWLGGHKVRQIHEELLSLCVNLLNLFWHLGTCT